MIAGSLAFKLLKEIQSIDVLALQAKIKSKVDFLLIDVREPFEHEHFNIGGLLIEMNHIFHQLNNIPKHKTVVLYCQKGIRSALVIQRLQQKIDYHNLINLAGGMDAWQKKIL